MATLTTVEKSKLEKLFRMGNGYVLGFSDKTLQGFVLDSVRLDILEEKYKAGSGSKANRLRAFWSQEPDHIVGKLTQDLLDSIPAYWEHITEDTDGIIPENEKQAYQESQRICERLLGGTDVEHLETLQAIAHDDNFTLLAQQIRASIENGEPEAGLDRLHTFLVKYCRHLCDKYGIATNRDEPLNAVFGKYVKALTAAGKIKSEMSANILRYSITILSSFNYVRNNQSLAHDNEMLNREESLLIFRNVSALVKFIEFVEGS